MSLMTITEGEDMVNLEGVQRSGDDVCVYAAMKVCMVTPSPRTSLVEAYMATISFVIAI